VESFGVHQFEVRRGDRVAAAEAGCSELFELEEDLSIVVFLLNFKVRWSMILVNNNISCSSRSYVLGVYADRGIARAVRSQPPRASEIDLKATCHWQNPTSLCLNVCENDAEDA
jgi:hypothetical protein